MANELPDSITLSMAQVALQLLNEQAMIRWGESYVSNNQELMELAARYMTAVAENLPETETEPGFYQ